MKATMAKLSVSFEWLSSCSGCEVSLVDLHERLLTVLDEIEIVRLPILMDRKDYPKAKLGIVSGAIRTEHDVECARHMRESCDLILSFGVCAVYGGPQGSCYAHTHEELEATVFRKAATTSTNFVPDQGVPKLLRDGVRPLDSEIVVDHYLPGCPPSPYFIAAALKRVIAGVDDEFGPHNVCFRCNRKMKQTDCQSLKRDHEVTLDPSLCFLSQGVLCLGSASLDRCLAPCPKRGVPCTGCGGPSEFVALEPHRDIRTEVAGRMSKLTKIPAETIEKELETQAKTHYAYAMASPVFRQKPTFLIRKWTAKQEG
jgi:F420-non-reducing hydrogenase small subunit